MTINEIIERQVQSLPAPLRDVVRAAVRFQVRDRPNAADLDLGAEPGDRGLFVGFPVRAEGGEEGEGELYGNEGDDLATVDGVDELRADDGDLVAEVEPYQPGGVIVLFRANIRPFTEQAVIDVILHELAHFFGDDEHGVFEMGLGSESV